LQTGDILSRAEFERRYHAHPEIKKAELIEGTVYMPFPVRLTQHAEPHANVMLWLGMYKAATKGVRLADNTTVRLDFENEVQPDALLYLPQPLGGQTKTSDDDYLEGAPELIAEIAASSASYDMHQKKRVYARNRVKEYLVFQVYEQKVDWFVLRDGVYKSLQPDEQNVWRSELFPGLWLDAAAFWNDDLSQLLQTLQQGLATPEHQTFAAQLLRAEG
jgi:Uma2 family endonuclease